VLGCAAIRANGAPGVTTLAQVTNEALEIYVKLALALSAKQRRRRIPLFVHASHEDHAAYITSPHFLLPELIPRKSPKRQSAASPASAN
jgi:hypothetical protein